MATITSPILLDTTGQSIVSKLDDIKTAINNSGGGGGSNVSFANVGTPSSTTTAYQQLTINNVNYEINGTKYMEQSVNLSSSASTTVLFTNADITTDSLVDVYTSQAGLSIEDMVISTGSCQITFPQVESASTISVKIYIR